MIQCLFLNKDLSCEKCGIKDKCYKVWKERAFDLAKAYGQALEHVTDLTLENERLRNRIDELADIATIKVLQEELNEKDKNRYREKQLANKDHKRPNPRHRDRRWYNSHQHRAIRSYQGRSEQRESNTNPNEPV